MLEIKLFMVRLLSNFRLVANDKTELGEIEVDFHQFTICAKNGVHFTAVKLVQPTD